MIRCFYTRDNELCWDKNPSDLSTEVSSQIVWVDLQEPSPDEQKKVEEYFGIEFFTPQEAAEIESSSRFFEDSSGFEANSAFLVKQASSYTTKQVSFIFKNNILFTLRHSDLKSFAETVRKLM